MRDTQEGHQCILPRDSGTTLPSNQLDTTPWQRFRRRLRKLFLLSPSHPDTETFFRSFAQITNENRRLVQHYPGFVIHPLSGFRKYWNIVIGAVLAIHLMLLSFVVSYLIYMDVRSFGGLIQFDLILCVILAVEIVLKFFTGYVVLDRKQIVLEPKKIVFNYFKYLRVVFDLLDVVPFILLLYKLNDCYYDANPRFYLTIVLFLYAINIFRFREINRYLVVIPKLFRASENKIIIMRLIIGTIYVVHWTACVGDIVPLLAFQATDGAPEWNNTDYLVGTFLVNVFSYRYRNNDFAEAVAGYARFREYYHKVDFQLTSSRDHRFVLTKLNDALRNQSIPAMYVRAVMDTIQVTMQSSRVDLAGTSRTSDLISSFLVLCGWLWLSYILLNMIRMVISSGMSETKYEEIINELNAYAYNKRLSPAMTKKMLRHFANRYQMRYFDEEAIHNTISNNLRRSIRMETCQHLVKNVELFRDLPNALIAKVVDRLKLEIYLENDVIIQEGSYGDAMYFIASGTAGIYTVGGKEVVHLVDGAHFGEISLMKKDQKRIANVVALEVCEVYKLSYADFQVLIAPYTNLLKRMEKLADERLAKTQGTTDKLSEEDVYENFLQ